jgi:hypothetical protein
MSRREIVHRGFDPVFTQVLCDVLRQEGLDPHLSGAHASTIFGVGQSSMACVIDVPEADAERARELIAAYQVPDPDDAPDKPIIKPEVHLPRPRVPGMAPGLAAIIPGGGHLYALRSWSGVAVLLAQVGILVYLLGQGKRTAAALAVSTMFLFDAIGGFRATRAHNRGVRVSAPRQLTVVSIAALLAVSVAQLLAPWVNSLRPPRPVGESEPGVHGGTAGHPEDLPFPMHLDLDGRPVRR